MHELTRSFEFERVAPDSGSASTYTLSAGTSDVNSSSVDCAACLGVTFVVALGAIVSTGTFSAAVQGSNDNSTFTAVTGLSVAVDADTDDNKLLIADVAELTYRYYRLAIDRGTANSSIDSIVAVKKRRRGAVTQGATVEATDI